MSDNTNNLLEETADVILCLELLISSFSPDNEKTKARIEEIKAAKLDRWLSRLGIEEK